MRTSPAGTHARLPYPAILMDHPLMFTAPLLRLPGIASLLVVMVSGSLRAQEPLEFNRDIRPILAEHCFGCHGVDPKSRQAELRLDTLEGATVARDAGPAIQPGNASASALYQRIIAGDPDVVMPPPSTKNPLSDAEQETLRLWIEQGASYQNHWAFELPVRRPVPEVPQSAGVVNEVDAFLWDTLNQRGLAFSPEADRRTLIRRVSFALTGLPPTVEQVRQFVNDPSADAYPQMVDRFLASPHFGEEQARHWLDVARYADTHGLHLDNERWMWVYRDWVVSAFNQNLPFDQFTIWQLAGDQLPDPTQEQLVATGFNRCNVTTSEGGAIVEEFLHRYAVDRTSTTLQAWMGLTAGCAVCHDHKYDPVTQKDFYSLYSFFYSASDPAMDGNIRDTAPYMKAPTAAQAAALSSAQQSEQQARDALRAALTAVNWTDPPAAASPVDYSEALFDEMFPPGTRSRNTSRDDVIWRVDPKFGAPSGRRVLEPAFGSDYDLTIELTLMPFIVPHEGQVSFQIRIDPLYPPDSLSLKLDDGSSRSVRWTAPPAEAAAAQPAGGDVAGSLPAPGKWVTLSVSCNDLKLTPGQRIRSVELKHTGGRFWLDDMRISGRVTPADDPRSSFERWWVMSKGTNPDGVPQAEMATLTAGPSESVATEARDALLRYWQSEIQRSTESPAQPQRVALDAARVLVEIAEDDIPGTFRFGDIAQPRQAHLMIRGQYDKPGEAVEPGVPAAFAPLRTTDGQPFAAGQRPNRLDLARWLLAPENPLTARVAVNRLWQQMFGTGLVKTSDDFGTRGDLPSHPELLDWLAIEFRQSGWDMKRLLRTLLLSRAFRQQSVVSMPLQQLDPENRLLARGPRFRLDAEQLRDNALFVSGLLDPAFGGRGAMPYQPPAIWEPVGYQNSNTRFYLRDDSAGLYRRSVYCFLKRTAPPPFMSNFDGPNREQSCSRRERSNTPLQALQLMNDVQHFEAARALAERTLSETGMNVDLALTGMFETVLAREPEPEELAELKSALAAQQRAFQGNPAAAAAVVDAGDSEPLRLMPDQHTAAWTMIANLILNLDETVSRN
jgi:hypothetical protein